MPLPETRKSLFIFLTKYHQLKSLLFHARVHLWPHFAKEIFQRECNQCDGPKEVKTSTE